MALWTNREKNSQQQETESTQSEWSELSKLEETQKLLKEKAEAQIDRLSELPGIIVCVEGHGFCKKDKLKFSVDDENYIFTRYFEKNDCIFSSVYLSTEDKIESYKQMIAKYNEILGTQPLFLKKSEYSSKDLPLDTQIQKSETYTGETGIH